MSGESGGDTGGQGVGLTGQAFLEAIPKEFHGHSALAPIKDMGGLVKGYIHAQSLVGADKLVLPKADAPETEWRGVYQKLGLPESPDQYGFELPKDIKPEYGISKESMGEILKWFHEAGLDKRQATKLANKMIEARKATYDAENDDLTQAKAKFQDELKRQHGDALDVKLAHARQVVGALGGKDLQAFMDETGLGDHPMMVKMMLTLGELVANDKMIQDKFASQGFISNAEEAKAEIAKLRADDNFMKQYTNQDDPNHAAALARMQRLYGIANPGKMQM